MRKEKERCWEEGGVVRREVLGGGRKEVLGEKEEGQCWEVGGRCCWEEELRKECVERGAGMCWEVSVGRMGKRRGSTS